MKILFVNTSDWNGGAAIAARRLGDALSSAGVEVSMLVLRKGETGDHIFTVAPEWKARFAFLWERLVIWINNGFSRKNLFKISIADTGFDITQTAEFKAADIIHLHWVNQGLLSLGAIDRIFKSGKPIVWTMHDMWECTSICHHAYGCGRFKSACRDCGFLRFPSKFDLSARVFKQKREIFHSTSATFVAVSRWLAEQARESTLLRGKQIEVIPNTLSLARFELLDREECRQRLALPSDKFIVLFGAVRVDDPIKGFPVLMDALQRLAKLPGYKDKLHFVFLGKIKNRQSVLPLIPVSYTYAGWVDDPRRMSEFYSASNIVVSASRYEAFGQTLIEAQACGCLPVSFGNSGQADIIRHGENGFLVDEHTAEALAEGIGRALEQEATISREALRKEVLHRYSEEKVASEYLKLYRKLLNASE